MGVACEPEQVKLIAGLLVGDEALLDTARKELGALLGEIELVSPTWPFGITHYYEEELGKTILRQFVSFAEPFAMERLAEVKLATNDLEARIAGSLGRATDRRPVNIDPGYITLGSLVLGTTKSRAHRIYLGQGIFAEVTLGYERGGWRGWPWTYPDYAADTYHPFFSAVRERLKAQRRGR
jgi:hypothetical protein